MSKAFKCDRCGKVIEGYCACTVKVTRTSSILAFTDAPEYELCTECHEGLMAFINEIQGEERHYEIQS